MVKKLYLMRHGQTLFNLQNKIQGWCDSPLTELGQYQAKVAGQYFKDHQITFDHDALNIIFSPFFHPF